MLIEMMQWCLVSIINDWSNPFTPKCLNPRASIKTWDNNDGVDALHALGSSSDVLLLDDNFSLACCEMCNNKVEHVHFVNASISNLWVFLLLFGLFLLDEPRKKSLERPAHLFLFLKDEE